MDPRLQNRPAFAIGTLRPETKSQRKERLKKEKERKRRDERRSRPRDSIPLKSYEAWCLIPGPSSFCMEMLPGSSYFSKLVSLQKVKTSLTAPFDCPFWPSQERDKEIQSQLLRFYKTVEEDLFRNQQIRWTLKKLITPWRLRHMKQANDVDPITLNPVQHPIVIYLFSKRLRYQFEAQPFALHIHKKLLHNDGQIPNPVFPKNPLTNERFSVEQFASLHSQCKQYGYTFWTLEAFQAAKYCLVTFTNHQQKLLRLHAIRATLNDPKEYECIDTVYDFIQSSHTTHSAIFLAHAYKWAVYYGMDHPVMQSWRMQCLKWYETDILTDDADLKSAEFRRIEQLTLPLCEPPTELLEARKKFLDRRRNEVPASS